MFTYLIFVLISFVLMCLLLYLEATFTEKDFVFTSGNITFSIIISFFSILSTIVLALILLMIFVAYIGSKLLD